jgi:hypothetical protein
VRLRSLLLLASLFLAAFSLAQSKAHIEFDSARHCLAFTSIKPPTAKPEGTQDINDTSADIPLPTTGTLYLWDRDSGNIASKPVKEVGEKWHVFEKDFDRIGLVAVRAEYQGEPVASARIVLKDKSREQSQILDSTSEGEADFYVVQPGAVTVTVEYKSGDSAAQPVVQQFTLDLARKTTDPLLKVELPNEVQTIAPTTATTQTKTPDAIPAKPISHANPFGAFITFIFTLLIAVAIAYGLYLYAKKNNSWLKGKLTQLGVDIPDHRQSQTADDQPIPVVEPPKPKAPTKIILDGATIDHAAVITQPQPQQAKTPRLVKPSGEFATLADGETIVGRDETAGISLVGENSVSRRHASITRQNSQVTLKDLGSTNGTFVNGNRLQSEIVLRSGDDVQFGAVKFRVEGL